MDRQPLTPHDDAATPATAGRWPPDLYLRLVAVALEETGRRWQPHPVRPGGQASSTMVVNPPPQADRRRSDAMVGRRAVVAYTDGDLRGAATRPLADGLERHGWEVHLLGATMSCTSLAAFAGHVRPDLVAVLTSRVENLLVAADAVAALRRLPSPPLVAAGGRAYHGDERLAVAVGADLFYADPAVFVARLRERLD